jgi:hypothetical protein
VNSKFLWHNFTDSRRLQGDDARVEKLGQQMGLSGESSPVRPSGGSSAKPAQKVAGGNKEHTAGEVQRAKEEAVGGKADKCIKGKSCSATCIHRNDDCLVGLSPSVAVAVTQVSKVLSQQLSSGRVTEEEAEQVISEIKGVDKAQLKAFDEFKKLLDSEKVSEQEKDSVGKLLISTVLTPGQDRNAPRVMSFDEVEAALKPGKLEALEKAYQNSFSTNGKFDPSGAGGMGDLIKKNFLVNEVSDEVASVAYYMLPSKMRSAIDKAGAVKGTSVMYAGDDKNGNPTFSDTPTRERGIFLVKRWMEQGGLDPYTGKPIDIRNAEPEHMVAFAHALAKGGGGDQPRNLLWSASQPNNQKAGADDDFKEWKRKLQSYSSMGREAYNKEVYNPAQAEAETRKGRKGSAPTDIGKALDSVSPQERVNTMKGLIKTYGSDVKYLVRAAGVGWQHQDRDLDHRMGGKPAFMNNGVPKLPGTNVKPSTAVLIALSSVDPSRRKDLMEGLEKLRKARILSDGEAQEVRGDNAARLKLQGAKSKEYGDSLASLLGEFVPGLGSLLS